MSVDPALSIPDLMRLIEHAADQYAFPVVGPDRRVVGVIPAESLRVLASNPELWGVAIAADLMGPLVAVRLEDDLRTISQLLVATDLRALPVIGTSGDIVAMLDEHDISVAVLAELAVRGS